MVSTLPVVAVPPRLLRLADLAYNLWWSWHEPARSLFRSLDPVLWEASEQNPVLLLLRIAPERLAAAAEDPNYLRLYDAVMDEFDATVTADDSGTWLAAHEPDLVGRPGAYFSAEFGLHRALPIYSGGLGVLAGDHIKQASDLGLNLIGVSLLYRQGYLRQRLTQDGWQEDVPGMLEPGSEPTTQVLGNDGLPCAVEVPIGEHHPLRLHVWRVDVGRVPLLLLDSDVDGNPDWTRTISSRLYGGDREHRLRQEIILGIGGVRALRAMGHKPEFWHANEGHAALHLLERVREVVQAGHPFQEAARLVSETTVFTSHTPVPAGHDVFSPDLIDRYFHHYWTELGLERDAFHALGHHGESGDGFNLTALSMRLADYRNGVSERHGEITRAMWHDIWPGVEPFMAPITSITNGVHLPTWLSPHIAALLDRHLDPEWRATRHEDTTWAPLRDVPDEEFWRAHLDAKQDLFDLIDERSRRRWIAGGFDPWQVISAGPFLQRNVLTLGFARRFATYKRATLIFHDMDRLAAILNDAERPVQIVFAGKAHPADDGGKRMIQEIYHRARDPRLGGRIAFAEDYDMGLAAVLVAGVDVWLNNPRAPMEASGTSGMKAAANGVPNLSILDGWWREGWLPDNSNGWGIEPCPFEGEAQDAEEAAAIYEILEREVVPLYYDRNPEGIPVGWCAVAKESIRTVAPRFSAQRMVVEYIHRLYRPAAGGA